MTHPITTIMAELNNIQNKGSFVNIIEGWQALESQTSVHNPSLFLVPLGDEDDKLFNANHAKITIIHFGVIIVMDEPASMVAQLEILRNEIQGKITQLFLDNPPIRIRGQLADIVNGLVIWQDIYELKQIDEVI